MSTAVKLEHHWVNHPVEIVFREDKHEHILDPGGIADCNLVSKRLLIHGLHCQQRSASAYYLSIVSGSYPALRLPVWALAQGYYEPPNPIIVTDSAFLSLGKPITGPDVYVHLVLSCSIQVSRAVDKRR